MSVVAQSPLADGRPVSRNSDLPVPPSDAEKASYADRNLALIVRSSLASFGALLISQSRFVLLSAPLLGLAPFIAFTLAYYLISLCVNFGTRGFDLAAHRRLVSGYSPKSWPSLDIFLPICGERLDVLANTWEHVGRLVRGYPGEAVAYVLDDGSAPDARLLAKSFGFTCIARPDRGWMKKAGNLRHAFRQTFGEFILILDADFAPRADLPTELLPYLFADPTLGIIQSPQFFHTDGPMSWMQRGAGAVQELFYRLVQVSRDRHAGAICVGSCAIYRRVALAVNGGTTLIRHSEDVHTGFDLRRAGWGLRYVPIPLATGMCPSDPDSFLTQQYRWCAGSMSLLASRKFWTAPMRLRTRFCYLSGFCYYVHTAMFTFVTPLIPLILLVFMPGSVRLINYLFITPSVIYSLVVFPAWHRGRYGPSALMTKLLYGWAHLFALWDIVRRNQLAWQPTGTAKRRRAGTGRVWVGVTVWNGGSSLAWVLLALWRLDQYGARFLVLLATGLLASGITAMALLARWNHLRASQGV